MLAPSVLISKDSFSRKSNRPLQSQASKELEFEAKDREIFGPCSYEDIDNYFSELCQENRTKISSVKKLAHYTTGLGTSPLAQDSPEASLIRNAFRISPVAVSSDSQREPRSASRKRTFNFTAASAGSYLDAEGVELLKEFGITQAILMSMETEEQKQNYIVSCMKRKLDEDYEKWKKDLEKGEKDIQKFELQNDQRKKKFEKEKMDIFKWLKLKTKFPFLKKKLKLGLMEILNDFDNQKDIEKSLDDIRLRDKSIPNSTRRITLENIPAVSNTEILADVLGNNEAIFKIGKTYRNKKNKQKQQNNSFTRPESSRSLSGAGSPQSSYYFNTSRFSVPKLNNTQNISLASDPYGLHNSITKINRSGGDTSMNKDSQYTWDDYAENDFKTHKEEARARMFNEIKSSSWNEVGLRPFIQASHKEEMQKSQRNHLLERYKRGEALGIEEYGKIANTSLLLNSCADTHFIQNVVDQLDPEIIEAVEIDLAQKILHDYQKNRCQVQKARMEFLKLDNLRIRKKVQENNEKHDQTLRVRNGQEEQERMLREMSQKYENYQKHMKNREKTPEEPPGSLMHINSQDETKKINNSNQTNAAKSTILRKEHNHVINVKVSKRYNHPSSKLLITTPERQKDYLGLTPNVVDPKISKRRNEDPKEYMLQIHSALSLKNKTLFSRFYSGGPPEYDYEASAGYYATDIPKFKGTTLEHKAATLLKSHIKGFLEREKFRVTKRHILDDRKVVRSLKNNEDGLPNILKAVFLALTEEKSDNALNQKKKKRTKDSMKLKTIILELQKKDPILFRQFQREIMKQYYYYQMTHHRNRNFLASTNKISEAEQERKSLIASLKNAMNVIEHHTEFTSLVLDDEDEDEMVLTKKNNDSSSRGSVIFQRKGLMSPTMMVGTLMNMNDLIHEKEQHTQALRPSTASLKGASQIQNLSKTELKKGPKSHIKPFLDSDSSVKVRKNPKSMMSETLKTNISRKSKHDIEQTAQEELKQRAEKIQKREAPKGLLLKQRKLFTATKAGNLNGLKANSYTYSEADVNVKDDKRNTPLYYAASSGDLAFCQYLTDLNARVNEHCEKGNTPLHMAFKSDNEAVIMLLLVKGGNLNMLNNEGFTPLAYGSERVLSLLDLKSGIATYNRESSAINELPAEYDNNYLLNRGNWKKPQEDSSAAIKYKSITSNNDPIRSNGKLLSHYIQPDNSTDKLTKRHIFIEQEDVENQVADVSDD